MDKFDILLKSANIIKLKTFISSLIKPCYESDLLKITFKNVDILNCGSLILYQNHFVLFHILHKLQDEFQKKNKYLHIHFMRTFLLQYPKENNCRFFNENTLNFCNTVCENNKYYCDFHYKKIGNNIIDELSSKYFYLDKENFFKLNDKTAEAFISGTWEILANYDEYKKSFKILDLPESVNLDTIKKRFRYLAKKHHPDCSKEFNKEFNKINNAYQFLLRMYHFRKIKI